MRSRSVVETAMTADQGSAGDFNLYAAQYRFIVE